MLVGFKSSLLIVVAKWRHLDDRVGGKVQGRALVIRGSCNMRQAELDARPYRPSRAASIATAWKMTVN
jgi:hypothetical protein